MSSTDTSDEGIDVFAIVDYNDEEVSAVAAVLLAVDNTTDLLFHSSELNHLDQNYVDPAGGVTDQLGALTRMPSLFATMTNMTVDMFNELSAAVCPVIQSHARSTGDAHTGRGRPPKLSPEQRLLSFLLFLKHDNLCVFDGHHWNWSKSSVNDDSIFVSSCVNAAIANEIRWPTEHERRAAGTRLADFPGCIGHIDGTLVKIRRPHRDPLHSRWFNGRKKIYCVNNTVAVDHDGLFIFIDCGYPGSFHDITILRHSQLHANWRDHFVHEDNYFQYLLGDPGYTGEDMYIMRRVARREIEAGSEAVIDAFNSMHAGRRVRVEWGIGGLKRKWKRLMKQFDSTKPKFALIFRSACLLTNFIHRRRQNMKIVLDADDDNEGGGWDGDY